MQNIQRGITPKPNKFCRSQLQIWLANSPQVLDLSFFYEKLVRELRFKLRRDCLMSQG